MKEATDLLKSIAAQLGVAVDHLWAALIRQAYVDGIQDVLWALMWLAVAIISGVVSSRAYREYKIRHAISSYNAENPMALCICTALLALLWFSAAVDCIASATTAFLNPEFWALKFVLKALGK